MEALMKNWWLDLYTIPALKKVARAFAIVFTVTLIVRMTFPQVMVMMIFFPFYITATLMTASKTGFGANIEFHKLHVAYPELRKALQRDMLIRLGVTGVALLLCFSLCATDTTTDTLFALGMAFGVNFGMCLFTGNVNKMVNGKLRFNVYGRDHLPQIVIFLQIVALGLVCFFCAVLITMMGFNPMTVLGFLGFGIVFFLSVFAQRALFHLEKEKGSFKTMVKYCSKGIGTATVVFLLGIVIFRPYVNDHNAGDSVQQFAFDYVGPFAPELDVETAKVLLTDWDIDKVKVFKGTPGINQVPVSTLFKKPTMGDYLAYVEGVDNPTSENLLYLLKTSQKYKGNPRLKSHLSAEVMKAWPKSQKFPEELLDQKMVKEERMPASTQDEPQN
jgi:hypothetical protein